MKGTKAMMDKVAFGIDDLEDALRSAGSAVSSAAGSAYNTAGNLIGEHVTPYVNKALVATGLKTPKATGPGFLESTVKNIGPKTEGLGAFVNNSIEDAGMKATEPSALYEKALNHPKGLSGVLGDAMVDAVARGVGQLEEYAGPGREKDIREAAEQVLKDKGFPRYPSEEQTANILRAFNNGNDYEDVLELKGGPLDKAVESFKDPTVMDFAGLGKRQGLHNFVRRQNDYMWGKLNERLRKGK